METTDTFMEHLQKAAIKANEPAKQPLSSNSPASAGQSMDSVGNTSAEQAGITLEETPFRLSDNAVETAASEQKDSTLEDALSRLSDSIEKAASTEQKDSTSENTFSGQPDNTVDEISSGQTESTLENTSSAQAGSTPENASSNQADVTPENTSSEQANENSDTASADEKKISVKKLAKYIGAGAAAVLLLTYLGVSFFFQDHFLFHTFINEQDFSCKTKEEARAFFAEQAEAYTLEIVESGGKTERIQGKEISMDWDDNLKLDYILDKQNAFAWPLEFFKEKSEDIVFRVSCDEAALSKKVEHLDAVTKEPTPPQSAYPKFDGNAFVIEPEIYGTALNSETLKEKTLQFVLNLEETMDLQEEGFYEKPKYTTESEEMIQVCKKLNDYCRASVTYEMDTPVVVDKTLISTWLSVDDNLNVILDEAAVRNWILEFDARYDTLGSTRPLTTPTGKATEVSGGTYGWSINEDEEFAALLNSIRNGEVLTRAVSYGQTAASHAPQDWGNTFLEVDLTTQHMWYLRDGAVVFESDVVTGSTPSGMGTPAGVYTILEKLSPTILVGNIVPATGKPEYRTPVDFWMRVTYSGIGFHDATWQPAFGGDVYLWNGSHGCINMPYYNAQELYSIIEVGLPVVIHY